MAIIIPQEEQQTINPPHLQPQADETTFGGGPGVQVQNQEMQKIAQSTNEIATFEKIRADQTAVQGATAQLSSTYDRLINDPKTGLPAYQGVNAMDGHDKVLSEFKKTANELSATLQPDQQGAFNKIAMEHGASLDQHAMGYVRTQLEQHDTNTFNASINNMSQNAASSYGNPDTVAMFKRTIDKMTDARAARLVLTRDESEQFKRNIDTKFHELVLSQMVNDPNFQTQAQQYFKDNKDSMDIDTREKVEKWLGDGSIKSQANTAVADIMKAHPKSESNSLEAADKITDPDVRSATRSLISSQFAQNRAAEKNDKEQTFNNVMDYVTKSGLTDPADIRNAIKTTDWNNMTGAQRLAVQKIGQDNITSPKMWADYNEAIKNGSLSEMSKGDVTTKFAQYASPSDAKAIMKTWAEGQRDTKNLAPTKTFHEMVDQAAVDAKIVSSPSKKDWSDDELHNWKTLGDTVQQQMEATERATGKKLSPANQQEIINKVVIDHTFTHKGIFSDDQTFIPFDNIPEDFISNARKEYPTATEDKIERAYAVIKGGGKAQQARLVLSEK